MFRGKSARTQFSDEVEAACAPLQFALSTRAGTDCVGHAIRVATELNPQLTVLSIDGVGAFDHVYRASMLEKLVEVPGLRGLLPFVKTVYSSARSYDAEDSMRAGTRRPPHAIIAQLGDPERPRGAAIVGRWRVFIRVPQCIYVLSSPERTRVIYDLLATTLRERAGIQLHTGKTRTWNCAVDMAELGPDVWNPLDIEILGTPVGHDEFAANSHEERLAEERKLWDAIPSIPDLQCSWQVLLQCAGPRCHHPHGSTTTVCRICAWARFWDAAHDGSIVGEDPRKPMQVEMARNITTLPIRMGGLGLRSAVRTAPGAFWASWVDALPMLQQRLPHLTGQVMHHLSLTLSGVWASCRSQCPDWTAWSLASGIMAGSTIRLLVPNTIFGRRLCLPSRVLPTRPFDRTLDNVPVRCCMERPLREAPIATVDHGGQVRVRVVLWIFEANTVQHAHAQAVCVPEPTERTLARVCREAGATVRRNAKLRDMNCLGSDQCLDLG